MISKVFRSTTALVLLLLLITDVVSAVKTRGTRGLTKGTKKGDKKDKKGSRGRRGPHSLGLVVVKSNNSFEDTYNNLVNTINGNPNINLIFEVDHALAAANAGLELEPNRVAIFGNPALGTPIMQAQITAALDLPQKMQVFEDAHGNVYLAYNPPEYIAARHMGTSEVASLVTIGGALQALASAATGVSTDDIHVRHVRRIMSSNIVSMPSNADFATTVSRLETAIGNSPANIALTVDHSANSGGVLPPTKLFVFGNPNLGTPLMSDSATAGIDLPLKIVVYEDEMGQTFVITNRVKYIKRRHALSPRVADTLDAIEGAIDNFMNAATGNN